MTSPVLMSSLALRTASGFWWFIDPRTSLAPHFEGQRWLSAGGFQDCASALAVVRPSASAAANAVAKGRMEPPGVRM